MQKMRNQETYGMRRARVLLRRNAGTDLDVDDLSPTADDLDEMLGDLDEGD